MLVHHPLIVRVGPLAPSIAAAVLGTLVGAKLYPVLVSTRAGRDVFSRGGFVFWGAPPTAFGTPLALVGARWMAARWRIGRARPGIYPKVSVPAAA